MASSVTVPREAARRTVRSAAVRLDALDAVRGLAIVGMLLVNNPGDPATTPWPLRHAGWHGLAPADLVFPLFLVAVGVAMPFSRRATRARSVLRRAALLWLIGAALTSVKYGTPTLGSGVLQHVAGAYVAGWALLRVARRRPLAGAAALLGALWLAMELAPHSWAPGANLAARVDTVLLGGPTSEGVLAMVASGGTVAAGAALGRLFAARPAPRVLHRRLAAVAAGAGAAGIALALAVPVNKHLWSPSYAVLTFGIAAALLLAAQLALERFGPGAPGRWLCALGENPIAVYAGFHLLTYTVLRAVREPVVAAIAAVTGRATAGVGYSLLVVAAAGWFAASLHRRGIVVRV